MTNKTFLMAAVTLLIVCQSCKKDKVSNETPPVQLNAAIQLLKTWVEQNPVANRMPPAKFFWEYAFYDENEQSYQVDMDMGNATNATTPPVMQGTLMATKDAQGNITGVKYLLIIADAKKMTCTDMAFCNMQSLITPEIGIEETFTGAVLEYDAQGILTTSRLYEKGIVTAGSSKLLAKQSNAKGSSPLPDNAVDPCQAEQMVCTDWYWQTFVDGVLVNEEYQFTTCSCEGEGGGGGAGGGPTQEQLCQAVMQLAINQGTNISELVSAEDILKTDEDWHIRYGWRVYRAKPGPWVVISSEKATLKKPANSNGPWEYKTFVHERMFSVGASQGANRSFQDLGANINMTPQAANVQANFSISFTILCGTQNYNATLPLSSSRTFTVIGSTILPPDFD
jgi:hypothetical protein